MLEPITCADRLAQIAISNDKKECKKTIMWHEIVLSCCGCPLVLLVFGIVYLKAGIN